MTDPDLLAKKLSLIEVYVSELQTLARPEAMRSDVRERRFSSIRCNLPYKPHWTSRRKSCPTTGSVSPRRIVNSSC